MSLCPFTGDYPCTCEQKIAVTTDGSRMVMDLKAVVRKKFTDHAVYTSYLLLEALPVEQSDTPAVVARLLRNPEDIKKILEPIIGPADALRVEQGFTNHLKLAAAVLAPLRSGNKYETDSAVAAFLAQGDVLGDALSNINPNKLSIEYARRLVRDHNNFVVQLAILRMSRSADYYKTFDAYYKHMLMFSDAVYETLTA